MRKRRLALAAAGLTLVAVAFVIPDDPEGELDDPGIDMEELISGFRTPEHLLSVSSLLGDTSVLDEAADTLEGLELRGIRSVVIPVAPEDGCDERSYGSEGRGKFVHRMVFGPHDSSSTRAYTIDYEMCATGDSVVPRRVSARFQAAQFQTESPPSDRTCRHPESLRVFAAALLDATVHSHIESQLQTGEVVVCLARGEPAPEEMPLTYTLLLRRASQDPDQYLLAFDAHHDPLTGVTTFGDPRPGLTP